MGYILKFIMLKVTFESESESDISSGLKRLVGLEPAYHISYHIFLIELRIYLIQTRGDSGRKKFISLCLFFLNAMQKWIACETCGT